MSHVYPLGRIVTSTTLASGDTVVGDLLYNPTTGALSVRGQTAGGSPVEVEIGTVTSAQSFAYTPANLVKWSNVAPSSIADALDRIAASVGPIP